MTSPKTLSVLLVLALSCLPSALVAQPLHVELDERIRGAERAVVGVVIDVEAVWQDNEFGDQLIVSHATVRIEETLKGPRGQDTLTLEIEGGTIGEVTLGVSDIEPVERGERGVFLLTRGASGEFVPHLRGQGILKLDSQGRGRGQPWALDEIRAAAHGQSGR